MSAEMAHRQQRAATAGAFLVAVALVGTMVALPGSEAGFSGVTANTANALAADTLDPPTALIATDGVTVQLDWTATAGTYASGYRILRSPTLGGPYTQIAELTPRTTVSYVDSAPEGIYYYVGRSFFGSWESTNSNETTGRAWRP